MASVQPVQTLEDQTDRLVRSTMLLGLAPAVLVGLLLVVLVHPILGAFVAVAIAAGWAAVVHTRAASASARVLSALPTTHLAAGSEPRLENLLESVCVIGGIEEPGVRLLSDGSLNALAVADRDGATFVVTRGLLDGLGRVELEAVLANLAARVKQGSTRYVTTVLALPLPSQTRTALLERGLGEQSSLRSDLAAVGLTKYPPGLISALERMEEGGTTVSAPAPTAPLWLAAPGSSRSADPPVDGDPQPLSLRIAVLQEL